MFGYSQTRLVHGARSTAAFVPARDSWSVPSIRVAATDETNGSVSISPDVLLPTEEVTAEHVEFARQLAVASNVYLVELVRMYEHDKAMDDADVELPEVA
jgi:hypothetical protein